jgi:diamine N-acetyltransferase
MPDLEQQIIAVLDDVRLRRTAESDLDTVLEVEHAAAQARFVIPWGQQRHRVALGDTDLLHAVIETAAEGRPVGFVLLAGLESAHQSIELRRIVIGQADTGKGYGKRVLRLVKRFAFEELGAHRLWLDVFEHNRRARQVYEQEGFVPEGRLRECQMSEDGGFDSLLVMSILDREYRALGPVWPSQRT